MFLASRSLSYWFGNVHGNWQTKIWCFKSLECLRQHLHDNNVRWKWRDFIFCDAAFWCVYTTPKTEPRGRRVTITEPMWKASSTAILSNENMWLQADYWRSFSFLDICTRKTPVFELSIFKLSILVSVFRSPHFSWRLHHFGVHGKLKQKEISSFSPNSVVV